MRISSFPGFSRVFPGFPGFFPYLCLRDGVTLSSALTDQCEVLMSETAKLKFSIERKLSYWNAKEKRTIILLVVLCIVVGASIAVLTPGILGPILLTPEQFS